MTVNALYVKLFMGFKMLPLQKRDLQAGRRLEELTDRSKTEKSALNKTPEACAKSPPQGSIGAAPRVQK